MKPAVTLKPQLNSSDHKCKIQMITIYQLPQRLIWFLKINQKTPRETRPQITPNKECVAERILTPPLKSIRFVKVAGMHFFDLLIPPLIYPITMHKCINRIFSVPLRLSCHMLFITHNNKRQI